MKFTNGIIVLLASCAMSVMAAPVPITSIESRGFFDDIVHGVESVVKPVASVIGGITGGGHGGQPQADSAGQQLFTVDANGNAVPVEAQAEQQGSGGFLGSITSGISNLASGVAGKIGGLIGGDEGASEASSIVGGIGEIATEAAPLVEEVAPLALAAAKQ